MKEIHERGEGDEPDGSSKGKVGRSFMTVGKEMRQKEAAKEKWEGDS